MSDIFLSYAREDSQRVMPLVEALRNKWSVFWDPAILPGELWTKVIETELANARCVVMVLSEKSVQSRWVLREAGRADQRGVLIPVLLDAVEMPLEFSDLQAANLVGWSGSLPHNEFGKLEQRISALVSGRAPAAVEAGAKPSPRKPRRSRPWLYLAWLILPTLAVAAIVLILVNWNAPTAVEIDAIATSVQFHGSAGGRQALLDESLPARWLALQGFDEIRFTPAEAWIADPSKHNFQNNSFPPDAWTALPPGQQVVLRPAGNQGAATLRAARPESTLSLGQIFAGSADITFRSPEKGELALELRGQTIDADIALSEEFRIDADGCVREGAPPPPPGSPIVLRARLGESSHLIAFTSRGPDIHLGAGYPLARADSFLARAGFTVDRVRFLEQGADGQPVSTLTGAGAIHYVGRKNDLDVPLAREDVLNLDRLEGFRIREIAPGAQPRSLHLRMGGVAAGLTSGPATQAQDRRRTYFDNLWQSAVLTTLFTILAWLAPTLLAARRFWQEISTSGSK